MKSENKKTALVVTSISAPNAVLKSLADGAHKNNIDFYVMGDTKSPQSFELEHCRFYGIEHQRELLFKFAALCPEKSYTRKNIGYLLAISEGADLIIETDDDNYPEEAFWSERRRKQEVLTAQEQSWLNIYAYFSKEHIWPRGFALEHLQKKVPALESFPFKKVICPLHQGLADGNPDVDAIFRLAFPLPIHFKRGLRIAVGENSWCPFNSQNTSWFKEVFTLLYLPSYCSFRMTDIWRSFVAQRILWENDWHILFHEPTVWQERNEHNLMKDFEDEIPGYLNNQRIVNELSALKLKRGEEYLGENLRLCYQRLTEISLIGKEELKLIDAWLDDLAVMKG